MLIILKITKKIYAIGCVSMKHEWLLVDKEKIEISYERALMGCGKNRNMK